MTEKEKNEIIDELTTRINQRLHWQNRAMSPVRNKWIGNNQIGHGALWNVVDDPMDIHKIWIHVMPLAKTVCGINYPQDDEEIALLCETADTLMTFLSEMLKKQKGEKHGNHRANHGS